MLAQADIIVDASHHDKWNQSVLLVGVVICSGA